MPGPSRAYSTCVGCGAENPDGAKDCAGRGQPSTGLATLSSGFAGSGATRDNLSSSRHRSMGC